MRLRDNADEKNHVDSSGRSGRKNRLILFGAFMLLLCHGVLRADALDNVSAGSRPAGLGHSFTGLANDANAPLYNAAGSAYLEKSELTFQNIFFKEKLNSLQYISFSQILGPYGTVSMGVMKSALKSEDRSDSALNLAYGRSLFWFLSAGFNLNLTYQVVGEKGESSGDLDLSLYFDPTLRKKREIQDLLDKTGKFIDAGSRSALKMGREAFDKKKYLEAIGLFQEALKYDPGMEEAREYLGQCGRLTGLDVPLPPRQALRSRPFEGGLSLEEREAKADEEYRKGLEHYYREDYVTAVQSFQRALDFLYVNSTMDRMRFGFTVRNLFRHTVRQRSGPETAPLQLRAGLIYYIFREAGLVAEFSKKEGSAEKLGLGTGVELHFQDFLVFRMGIKFSDPISFQNRANQVTAGAGLIFGNYSMDYAFEPDNALYNHTLSLSLRFGAGKEEAALEHLNRGIIYAKNARHAEAEEEWKKALLLDPGQVMARKYLKGELASVDMSRRQKEEDASREAYEKGKAFFMKKDYVKARAFFMEALMLHSQNTQARSYYERARNILGVMKADLLIRGREALKRGELENALESLEGVVRYDPEDGEARKLLSEARKQYKKEIARFRERGAALYERKQYAEADTEMGRYLKFVPEDREAREYKYRIEQALEKEKAAGECARVFQRHTSFFSNRNFRKAKDLLREVQSSCPDYPGLEEKLALCDRELELEKGEREKKARADDYFKEGVSELKKNNYEQALDLFRQAQALNPALARVPGYIRECESRIVLHARKGEQTKKAALLFQEGVSLLEKEKYNESLKKLKLAALLDEGNDLIRAKIAQVTELVMLKIDRPYQEGIALFNEGRLAGSMEKFNQVLRLDPGHYLASFYLEKAAGQKEQSVRMRLELGAQFMNKKEYSRAIKEYREVLALDPQNRTASREVKEALDELKERIDRHYHAGEKLFRKQEYSGARAEFVRILDLDPGYVPALDYAARCDQRIRESDRQGKIEAFLERGREYYKNRLFEEAEKELQNVLAVDSGHKEALSLLSECQKEIGDSRNKDKVSELFNLVARAYREENFREAFRILEDISRIDPGNELVRKYLQVTRVKWDNYCEDYYGRARKMEEEGDFFTAGNFYRKVLLSNTNFRDVRLILERYDQKIEDYVQSTRKKARQLYGERQYGDSYVLWDRISKLRPRDAEAGKYVLLTASKAEKIILAERTFGEAERAYSESRWKEALIGFQKALALNPGLRNRYEEKYKRGCEAGIRDRLNIVLNDGVAFLEKNDYTNAFSHLSIVHEIAPDNERAGRYFLDVKSKVEETSLALLKQSRDFFQRENWGEAYRRIRLALQYAPSSEEIRGFSKEVEERYFRVRQETERRTRKDTDALLFEGIRLYRAGRLSEAIAKWREVGAVDPGNSKARDYIVRAESKLKKLGGEK